MHGRTRIGRNNIRECKQKEVSGQADRDVNVSMKCEQAGRHPPLFETLPQLVTWKVPSLCRYSVYFRAMLLPSRLLASAAVISMSISEMWYFLT